MNCLPSNKFYFSYKREMYELFWYLTVYGSRQAFINFKSMIAEVFIKA